MNYLTRIESLEERPHTAQIGELLSRTQGTDRALEDTRAQLAETQRALLATQEALQAYQGRDVSAEGHRGLIDKKGIAKPVLRDEIFLQLCKFISLNPDPRTTVRGWILLCICIGIFAPTVEFELHLLNFLMYFETDPRHVQFARYCLSALEDELNAEEQELKESVYRKQLPSTEAIAATLHGDLSFLARSASPAR